MAKIKYYYDTKTLKYRRIDQKPVDKIKNSLIYIGSSMLAGVVMMIIFFVFFDSPKEKRLKKEIVDLTKQYDVLNDNLGEISVVLKDLQERDDNIYRVIFESEPIPSEVRLAGFGGVNRYKDLEKLSHSELIISTSKKIDQLSKQLYVQSTSFDEIIDLAKNKSTMLASMPSIQPVENQFLKRMGAGSGFGMRTHPIYKTRKMHEGMDFTAAIGTPIYATGNGTVEKSTYDRGGYGKHVVIDHGYGYKTLYAHMNNRTVKKGQKIKRGEIIGYVGNTGLSAGPHLHYEVHKDGKKVNPAYYFYNDLSPEEYKKMIEVSSKFNQSFD